MFAARLAGLRRCDGATGSGRRDGAHRARRPGVAAGAPALERLAPADRHRPRDRAPPGSADPRRADGRTRSGASRSRVDAARGRAPRARSHDPLLDPLPRRSRALRSRGAAGPGTRRRQRYARRARGDGRRPGHRDRKGPTRLACWTRFGSWSTVRVVDQDGARLPDRRRRAPRPTGGAERAGVWIVRFAIRPATLDDVYFARSRMGEVVQPAGTVIGEPAPIP